MTTMMKQMNKEKCYSIHETIFKFQFQFPALVKNIFYYIISPIE